MAYKRDGRWWGWSFDRGSTVLASALLRIPPLKFPSFAPLLPPFLVQSLLRSVPHSRRSCLVPSLPRSFPSSTLPPSTLPSSSDALCLPSIIASSLPPLALSPSLTPLVLSLPHHPLDPSLPPSLFPPSLPAPSLPAYLPPSTSMYTVYVCLARCTVLCSA